MTIDQAVQVFLRPRTVKVLKDSEVEEKAKWVSSRFAGELSAGISQRCASFSHSFFSEESTAALEIVF